MPIRNNSPLPKMKKFLLLITMLSSNFDVNAQFTVKDVAGTYERKLSRTKPHIIYFTLNLNADGTFHFHSYNKIGIQQERNSYAKGMWALDKKVVSFSTSSIDFDEKFTLDFNTSKARFISKHLRDKSDRIVETALQFYESEIFWIQLLHILKIESHFRVSDAALS